MGRQAHLIRVCLGRSAFEPIQETSTAENEPQALRNTTESPEESTEPSSTSPGSYRQQYDRKGYPENPASRALSRQSRRAINDILTTVGVCVGVDADGHVRTVHDGGTAAQDKTTVTGIIRENETGMLVGVAEAALDDLTGMGAVGLRQRIQTFRFYSGVPLTGIVVSEWRHFGLLKGLFAGGPADTAYVFLNAGRGLGMKMLMERLAGRLGILFDSVFALEIQWFLLKNAGRLFSMMILGLLTPLKIYSTLQRQCLLPAWPLFPPPKAFIPFSPSSPLRLPDLPDRLNGAACLKYLGSLALSPLVLSCLLSWTRPLVEHKVQKYTRAALPAPDSPDVYSIQAAIEDEMDRNHIPGLGNAADTPELWESRSVTEELAKDLQYIGRTVQILYDRLLALIPRTSPNPSDPPAKPTQTPADALENDDDTTPPASPSYDPSSSSASRPSTPPPQIAISGSSAINGTVHMSVAIPVPRRPHPRSRSPGPDTAYRVTLLTAQAADSMAERLAGCITDILLFPLEALYVRSVALSFLSSPMGEVGAAAERWKGEVYPLGGWFGMGLRRGWGGVADYVGKMVLVQGMEMGVGFAVWQVSVGVSWWVGRKWFEWGRL